MKQIIIMIATILLGLAIAGIILGFQDTAEELSEASKSKMQSVFQSEEIMPNDD